MVESKPKSKARDYTPRKITAQRLANIALHHLDRYASSAENLRRVLERRVYKAAPHHDDLDVDEAKGWIDTLIQRYVDSGLLDDRAYAETRARSLMSRGNSERMIRVKLYEKGVDADTIDVALTALEQDAQDPELFAAVKLARRRRLGPFGDESTRTANRDKHLAAMARAGFSYDMAQRVVDAADADELEDAVNDPL